MSGGPDERPAQERPGNESPASALAPGGHAPAMSAAPTSADATGETGMSAAAVEKRLRDSFARQTMMATLGASMDEAGAGRVVISAPVAGHILQQQGAVHGGVAFAIGDSASGYAALSVLPQGTEVVTVEMKINFMAPAVGDRLVAEGRVIRAGRRIVVVAADVWAEGGGRGRKHVATLLGTMMPVEV